MSYLQELNRKVVTVISLQATRAAGERTAMLTVYDSGFIALMDRSGTDVLLAGDSLGNVIQGQKTTLLVMLDHIVYHIECISRGIEKAPLVSDPSFGTYGTSEQASHSAVRAMQAGAQMVKLEGGVWPAPTIKLLVECSIPMCMYIDLMPQSVYTLGGFKVQGRSDEAAVQLKADALAMQDAGAQLVVMEAIPVGLADEVTRLFAIPIIGIGVGLEYSGQAPVMHDMLGVFPGHHPKFVCSLMDGQTTIDGAVAAYVAVVKDGTFSGSEHTPA